MKRLDFSELNVSESGTVTPICLDILVQDNTNGFEFLSDVRVTCQAALVDRILFRVFDDRNTTVARKMILKLYRI